MPGSPEINFGLRVKNIIEAALHEYIEGHKQLKVMELFC
jgi:hypothetical protein